ncbi:MAG TPA: MATE family efflux transporter [Bacillales bacterium]|nr:MATE family efflux transporter [Bacillales bacterium]
MTQTKHDFTEGPLLKKMLLFSGPIFLANLLQASYQIIDSLWVGNLLGAAALAAVALSATLTFTVLSFIIGMNRASLTILSQQKGSNDTARLRESLNAFVVVLGGLSLLLAAAGFTFVRPLLSWLGSPPAVTPLAESYLQLTFLGIPFLFGYNFISTVLRSLGDSKTPVRFVVLAVVLNAAFDPLFISVANLGIAGAALATVLSQGIAFGCGLAHCLNGRRVPFTVPHLPERKFLRAIFKLGIPGGLQMVSISAGSAAIVGVAAAFGPTVLAGYGASQRISRLVMMVLMTLSTAMNSMAGQNIGAGRWDRVRKLRNDGLLVMFAASLTVSAFVFGLAKPLVGLFVDDAATINFGADYLRAVVFFYPFLGINFVLNGIVRGAGAMVSVLLLNLISFWILRFPLSALFSHWMGAVGIAYGIGTSFVMSSMIAACYFRYGRWREVEIFAPNEDMASK